MPLLDVVIRGGAEESGTTQETVASADDVTTESDSSENEESADIYDLENRTYENVTIEIYTRFNDSDVPGQWYNRTIEEFMEEYPGITVVATSIPTEADYLDTLSIAMSDSGSMPNIFQEYGGSRVGEYVTAGNLVDLTPYFEADEEWYSSFGDVGWELTDFSRFGVEGIYGVPYSCYTICLFYNEDILAENGIDPDAILSWDDLMSACETLLNNGVQPFEIGEKDDYRFGHLHTILNYKTYGTDVAYDLGDRIMSYDSEEQQAIYQMIIDAYEAGYLGTNLLGTDADQETEFFNTGETAFHFTGSWYCANVGTGDYELYNEQKIHALAFPYVNEEYADQGMGGANEGLYVTDTGDEDEVAASILFLKYLVNLENINELVEEYPLLLAINSTVESDNYLLQEVQEIMSTLTSSLGDIENYDTEQHMINTVRSGLQGIAMGYSAEEVGATIVEMISQYE